MTLLAFLKAEIQNNFWFQFFSSEDLQLSFFAYDSQLNFSEIWTVGWTKQTLSVAVGILIYYFIDYYIIDSLWTD